MKIGQKPELPSTLVQSGSAKQQTKGVAASAAEGTAQGAQAASAAGVPVTVSLKARSLEQSTRTTADFDANRVKAVRTAIENGTFRVDAEAIADKMLSNAQEIFSRSRG